MSYIDIAIVLVGAFWGRRFMALWLARRRHRRALAESWWWAGECDRLVGEMHVAMRAADWTRLDELRAQWNVAFARLGRSTLGAPHYLTTKRPL